MVFPLCRGLGQRLHADAYASRLPSHLTGETSTSPAHRVTFRNTTVIGGEVEHAKEEGIDFRLLHNPVQYIGNDEGRVIQMECLKMALGEPDASGRRSPVPIQDSEFRLDGDSVVVAIGAATVILAMGHGRKAARSINRYLSTEACEIDKLP